MPGFELGVVLYGDEKEEVDVLVYVHPTWFVATVASLVNSNCPGEVFLLAPKSCPAVPPVRTLHALEPMAPLVVYVAL